ncbi:MAG: hypothetical protein RQ847_13015 [Wenzhouxiangellaceae bacterium]|nr:hypothetical protein [Wenzhouxiangellaceae bacterium]
MIKSGIHRVSRVRSRVLAAGMAVALAALAGAVTAQQAPQQSAPPADPSGAGELLQKVQQKQSEIQQLNQQLAQIQKETIEANPDLAAQRDDLLELVDTRMTEAGHDPDASREKIEDLQGQLDSGELSDEETRSVGQQLRQEQSSLQQARGQAMQDQQVRQKIQALNGDLVAAMREQNPRTDELIAQLQSAQQEYQALMQQAMQQRGGNDGQPH